MSLEDLPSAQQSKDSQSRDSQNGDSETGSRTNLRNRGTPVVAAYDKALRRLNRLDDPAAVVDPNALLAAAEALWPLGESWERDHDSVAEPAAPGSSENDRDSIAEPPAPESWENDGDAKTESSAPEHVDAPLDELNDLCGLGAVADAQAQTEEPAADSRTEETDRRDPAAEATLAENQSSLVHLSGPPSFDRVVWHGIEPPRPRVRGRSARGDESDAATVSATPADYQQALLQIIEEATNDPRQLRNVVFELARTNLKKEIELVRSTVTPNDIGALETAIARIEVDASRWERSAAVGLESPAGDQRPGWVPPFVSRLIMGDPAAAIGADTPNQVGAGSAGSWPAAQRSHSGSPAPASSPSSSQRASVEIVYPERSDAVRVRRRVWLWFIVWPFLQLVGPAIFCLFLYFTLTGKLEMQGSQARRWADTQAPVAADAPRSSGLPLPSTYGIYAISNGTLFELQPLPIRAPDPRIQLSAEINKPGATTVPDGHVVFVLFERDLLSSAPQKVTVRVVARVMKNMSFGSGKPAAVKPESAWHIRGGNPYTFPVAPLSENREMVAARPEDPALVLAAGRYALVVGGLAYDFTVDGPITDPAQCLESFEAVGGAVFTECGAK